jgi:hypothetical protein
LADFDEIAKRVADVAQRVADVSDAARGKGVRIGGGNSAARWLIMPAAAPSPDDLADRESLPVAHPDNGWYGNRYDDLRVHLQDRAERRRRRRRRTVR